MWRHVTCFSSSPCGRIIFVILFKETSLSFLRGCWHLHTLIMNVDIRRLVSYFRNSSPPRLYLRDVSLSFFLNSMNATMVLLQWTYCSISRLCLIHNNSQEVFFAFRPLSNLCILLLAFWLMVLEFGHLLVTTFDTLAILDSFIFLVLLYVFSQFLNN